MKLKTLVQGLIISSGIIALSACSSLEGKKNVAVTDANGSGAQTMGAGDSSGFGNDGSMNDKNALAKRVYYFDYDNSEVHEDDVPAINANAENILAHNTIKVLLEGHTDPRGSREYNVALGERRANAIAAMLKEKGVNVDQVRVISYGAERLAVQGRTEQDFEQDRRVVLVYLQQ